MTARASQVAARYGGVSRPYRLYWAPALAALARPLLSAMPLEAGDRVVDLGCGVGTIAARLAERTARMIGVDLAEGMLRRVPRAAVRPVVSRIEQLPFADESLDGAFSTFVLQHVAQPKSVFAEATRVLRPGAFIATATWGTDHSEAGGAYDVLDEIFKRHKIPPEEASLKTWHERVDDTKKMSKLATGAGLVVEQVWAARATYRWTPRRFIGWATTMGPYGRRLAAMSEQLRARVASDLGNDLTSLPPDAFAWRPEVVYLVALKP